MTLDPDQVGDGRRRKGLQRRRLLLDAPMRGADIADGVASIKTMVAIARSVASGKRVEVASATGAL